MRKVLVLLIVFILIFHYIVYSQVSPKDSVLRGFLIEAQYSLQFPLADLAKRYGQNFSAGGSLIYKTRTNFLCIFEANFIFGNNVKNKDGYLKNIKTSDGYVIDGNGMLGEIFLYERGYYLHSMFGKIFPVVGPNKNSGLFINLGVGFLQHKLKLFPNDISFDYMTEEYKKGYDRLANGLSLSQQIGYFNIGNKKAYSFRGAIELIEGFTKPRRGYQYDLMGNEPLINRFDMLLGLRFSWMIPLFRSKKDKFYYY